MSGNYPAGAEHDPNAPYNETVVPEQEFTVDVSVTLTKTVKLRTNNYTPEFDEGSGAVYTNTTDIDWEEDYKNQCYTIPELLEVLQEYLKQDLQRAVFKDKRRKIKQMIKDCKGWKVEDMEFEEV